MLYLVPATPGLGQAKEELVKEARGLVAPRELPGDLIKANRDHDPSSLVPGTAVAAARKQTSSAQKWTLAVRM